MRTYGARNPIDQIEMPPDTVQTLAIENSSGQAMDWFVATGAAADAAAAGAQLARFSAISTGGLSRISLMVNLVSDQASVQAAGTSISTTAGSTGNNVPVFGDRVLQIPGHSTGFSVASLSSGFVIVEIWKK